MRAQPLLRRPLVVFGVLLLVPSAGFCYLGWDSVQKDGQYRRAEMERQAQDAVVRRVREAAQALERLRAREDARHYYEYQQRYLTENLAAESLAFQKNGLVVDADDPRVQLRFQWERGTEGPFARPEFLRSDRPAIASGLLQVYGPALFGHLARAEQAVPLRTGRRVEYPLHVVGANEERGQILEELEVRNQTIQAQQAVDPSQTMQVAAAETPYLESFRNRMQKRDPVAIRYTRFRYLAAPRGSHGPALVAWRLVWIPATHADRREVRRDRFLLQGYALDPAPDLPDGWTSFGNLELATASAVGRVDRHRFAGASLATTLDAEVATPEGRGGFQVPDDAPFTATDRLVVVGRPDETALASRSARAVRRFLLLVGGLLVIVVVGFFVLLRGVRREVALARRKEDFIAAITHELKTPLTGIRMYADMIKEGWLTDAEAAEKYAARILTETERLGHLVNQVLDLAALERGVAALSASEGDLGKAVSETVELLATRAAETGTSLDVDVAADLPRIPFDPKLVRPLVLNLVDNAIKYSERAATKAVRVTVFRDGERVCVRVADQGVGIPREARKSLFEPFRRAGGEMTRSAPGVGIGLALVKRYADAHRARVIVDSEVGVGTTVTVRFPVTAKGAAQPREANH